jgi:hypothetical protein
MRSLTVIIAGLLLAMTGCVSMPQEVPENYLVNKTAEEGKALDKLATGIIAKNQEMRGLKDRAQEARQKIAIEQGRLDILKEEKKLLDNKQKQYVLENDTAKITDNQKLIADKDAEVQAQDARLAYTISAFEYARAKSDVAEAELAVMVAELGYAKAKIAKSYLLARQTAAGTGDNKTASPDPTTYDEKYRLYLEKQRENLTTKKNQKEESSVKMKIAEDKMKK